MKTNGLAAYNSGSVRTLALTMDLAMNGSSNRRMGRRMSPLSSSGSVAPLLETISTVSCFANDYSDGPEFETTHHHHHHKKAQIGTFFDDPDDEEEDEENSGQWNPQHHQPDLLPHIDKLSLDAEKSKSDGSGSESPTSRGKCVRFATSTTSDKEIGRVAPITPSSTPSAPSPHSSTDLADGLEQYANIDIIHQQQQQAQQTKAKVSPLVVPPSSAPVMNQKSILKDSLCSNLRSAVRQGNFVLTDTDHLESEIDALLYGTSQSTTLQQTVPPGPTEINFDPTSLLIGPDSSSTLATLDDVLFPAYKPRPMPTVPDECNSYVSMIEGKYRQQGNSSRTNKSSGRTKNKSRTEPPPTRKKISSKPSNIATNILPSGYTSHLDRPSALGGNRSRDGLFTTSIDQWMSTLMQESVDDTPSKVALPSTPPGRRATNEALFCLFADPEQGPSINLLMEQLKRSFNGNQANSDTESTRSRSVAENHIYEEILYECLEQNRAQANVDPTNQHRLI